MALLEPNPDNTLNPDRTQEFPLTSEKSGNTNYPPEFTGSTTVTTVTVDGVPIAQPLTQANPPQGLISSELQQDKTQERRLVQASADFTGLSLAQEVTDPIFGVSAVVTKSIVPTLGGVSAVAITAGGSAYTAQTTVTSPAPSGGRAAQYSATIAAGVITAITIEDPGSGHHTAPPIVITDAGGGTGATATAVIPVIPITGSGVETVTVTAGGSGYDTNTTVTATAAPAGGNTAILSPVISGGIITGINIISRGTGYSTVPTITITDVGGGTGATATATLGWTTFYDITPLQKWQSIQIASKININSLPAQLTLPKMQRLVLPDNLVSVSGQWSSEKGSSQTNQVNPDGLAGTAHCTCDGGINVQISSGFKGWAKGYFIRKFFSSLPTLSDLPTPTEILASFGTVVVNAKGDNVNVSFTQFSSSGGFSGMIRAHAISIGPVLTNGVSITSGTFSDSESISGSTSGQSFTASYNITANASATATFSMPTSTPVSFSPGDTIVLDGEVTQWRFGIYVLEYNEAFHP